MLRLKKIAVTGGLASGKSTVCRLFEKRGAYVVSADTIVHQLLSPQTAISHEVIKLLGPEIVSGGEIDRKKVAALVFNEASLLAKLEKILHPAVLQVMKKEYEKALHQRAALFVAEVPLLFESGYESYFDRIITVSSKEGKSRFKGADFALRESRLCSDAERRAQSDYIIENNGDEHEIESQINHIYPLLLKD